jgi:SAM-dependent methyltransferase
MGVVSAAAYHAGKFLYEQDLLPERRQCSWCRFNGTRPPVLAIQRNPDVWLLECPQCHAVSASRVATDAVIDGYYASYYVDTSTKRVTCGNPARHARHICRYAKPFPVPPRVSVLDFGGGDGSIGHAVGLELLRAGTRQVDVFVVDYNDRLTKPAHSGITLYHAPNLDKVPRERSFDLVLASAILEHLPEPADVTRSLLEAVAPGGFFYARTPYVVPLLNLMSRMHISYDFTFPAHFYDLGQRFWEGILVTLGMANQEWVVVANRPSVVETSFSERFWRTLISYLFKAPWWVLGRSYPFTGGWEVFIQRKQDPK